MIIRKKLTPDEISNPSLRFNLDDDTVEQSPDNGVTWIPVPELDPRHADGFRAPALESDDVPCDAAAGMQELMRRLVNVSIERLSAAAAATGMLATILALIPLGGILSDIIFGTASALAAVGAVALTEAFTTEVYDQLLCIFLNRDGSDGQIDATSLALIRSDITAQIGGVADTVLQLLLDTVGEIGLSNAGSGYALTGDCATCSSCLNFLGGDGLGDLTLLFSSTYDSGNDWILGANFGATMYASFSYTGTESMISIDFSIDRQNQSGALGTVDLYAMQGDNFGTLVPLYNVGGITNGGFTTHVDFTMPTGYDQLYFSPGATGSGSQTCTITKVSICSL